MNNYVVYLHLGYQQHCIFTSYEDLHTMWSYEGNEYCGVLGVI